MSKDNGTREKKSLSDIRDSVQSKLDALGQDLSAVPAELREIFDDLVTYHETLDNRERSMQGALVDLVDDMSQASRTITETGSRLEAILEAAEGVALIITNNENGGEIVEFSRGAERIFGYERSEIMGKGIDVLCASPMEADKAEENTNYRQLMKRKSGQSFPAIYSSHPLKDASNVSRASLIIVLDNTKQEMAERLFRESNERYQALALAAPISIITFDRNGIITFVNEWHMRMLDQGRMPLEYYLGKRINELPGIVHAKVEREIMPVLEGKPVSLEDVHVAGFGGREEGWFNIRLSPLMQDGEFSGGILIREDVTRRKRTELDLKLLIDSSPIPLFKVELTDQGGIIRSLNPEAQAMLGREALNKPVDDYISPVSIEEAGLAAMKGEPCEVKTVEGIRKAIRTSHQPSGRFEVQAVMDVSVLVEAKDAAEDASRTKSDFIANISHEIRTPLNVLLGMLQLFQDEELSDDLNEMLQHATGAGNSLLALLNDILDFTVVEARALALDEQEFNLADILELVAAPYRVEAGNKGIDFNFSLDPNMPATLWGDARRLRQVIFHVTGNGVKFTDEGGVLLEAAWVPNEEQSERGFIDITVSDTGIGMDQEQMTLIFEPFRQADGTRTRRHGGTGIGLALVYEFVKAMGGVITVDSKLGRGTRFHFTVDVGLVQNSSE